MSLHRLIAAGACCLLFAGCPPTGEPPAFETPDMAPAPDSAVAEDSAVPDAAPPDGKVPPPDMDLERPECVDHDGDERVEGEDCGGDLLGGDCAPMDGERYPGAPERCNLVDDNCNGRTDEDAPGGGDECETGELGLCARGLTTCNDQGDIECEPIERRQLTDDCDGLDEDCDGETDEDAADQGRCDTGEDGVCSAGELRCVGGDFVCVGTAEPGAETCNGSDDDCDGETDEGNPGGGAACETGLLGLCRNGVETCTGGDIVCAQEVQPAEEACNGLDDNCDGATDEAFDTLGEACRVGSGACARDDVLVCNDVGDGVECGIGAGDGSPELCNGVDDDCDETIDEGFELGIACEVGVGACLRAGVTICNAAEDGTACDAVAGDALDELCNGLDDDCDGETDEGFPVGEGCVDDSGLCDAPGVFACSLDEVGVVCDAEPVMPADEICNDFDDDCDDAIDEDFETLGDACEVGVGECLRAGELVCGDDGGLACSVEPGDAVAEACNGLDDDCDGLIDDRAPCVGPAEGRVIGMQIAAVDDVRCASNAIAGLGDVLNPHLTASFDAAGRSFFLRLPELPDAVDGAELVEADGPDATPRALDAFGRSREVVEGVRYVEGVLTTDDPRGQVAIVSPFFYDRLASDWNLATVVTPRLTGPVAMAGNGGLDFDSVVLEGVLLRREVIDRYRAASDACEADLDVAGCAVFDDLGVDGLTEAMVADVDLDGEEGVSACFVLRSLPTMAGPAFGGQTCESDEACYLGLSCRVVPVPDGEGDSSLGVRCGRATGAADTGDACANDRACASGLCVAATAAGAVCTTLCEADADCEAGWACRGVDANPEAISTGGRSARVCVPVAGSGAACGHDEDCEGDEVCGPWLAGEVGLPGGAVVARGQCQARDEDGARIGFRCDDALDCGHGNGCVPDLGGELRCSAPCDGPSQCAGGMVCTDRPVLDEVVHGACLPLPLEAGSGADCDGDLDCAVGETCAAAWLAGARNVETWCRAGAGPLAVGQRCGDDADCASGGCLEGVCSGFCGDHGDCGPRLACDADAAIDEGGQVLGGRCAGVDGDCDGLNRDCDEVAGCDGRRCVCDDNRCRIGCDFDLGVGCPGGLYCEPDDECAAFCRDDAGEPNDLRDDATPLVLDRRTPRRDERHTLCATSGIDWYRIEPRGRAFEVAVAAIDAVELELSLYDGAGALIDDGEGLRVALDEPAGATYFVRVRGGVPAGRADYQLTASLDMGECPDPADEPTDEQWTWTEVLAAPGEVVQERIDGWICGEDTDWYALNIEELDTLVIDVTPQGNGGRAPTSDIEVDVINVLRAGSVDRQDGQGRIDYTPQMLSCDFNALPFAGVGQCRFADNRLTQMVCFSAPDCFGSPHLVRVRGQTGADVAQYRLDFQITRRNPRACVLDLFEEDRAFVPFDWSAALLPPETLVLEGDEYTQAIGADVVYRGRMCGRDREPGDNPPPAVPFADVDQKRVRMDAGDTLHLELVQLGQVNEVSLRFYQFNGGWNALSSELSSDAVIVRDFEANIDAAYTVSIGRGINVGAGYDYQGSYELTMTRTRGAPASGDCATPTPLAFANPQTVEGTTLGRTAMLEPVQCVGGGGPEQVFRVQVPGGDGGTLTATVTPTADDGYDPSVSMRLNCAAAGTEVACNEDDTTAGDPFARARAEAEVNGGAVVYVVVDSFDADSAGAFELRLDWAGN